MGLGGHSQGKGVGEPALSPAQALGLAREWQEKGVEKRSP